MGRAGAVSSLLQLGQFFLVVPGLLLAPGAREAVLDGLTPGCRVVPSKAGHGGWFTPLGAGSALPRSDPHHISTSEAGDT